MTSGWRQVVLFLLVVTVIVPMLLYTDKLSTYTHNIHDNDGHDAYLENGFGGEMGKLNVLQQQEENGEGALKEPIGVVYQAKGKMPEMVKDEEITVPKGIIEYKARVLSATDEKNPIRKVTDVRVVDQREKSSDGLLKSDMVGGEIGRVDGNKSGFKEGDFKTDVRMDNNDVNKMVDIAEPKSGEDLKKVDMKRAKTERSDDQEVMNDARVRHLKDQLIRARVYLGLGATRNNIHFIKELRLRMKEVQRALGEATKDSELSRNADDKLKAMEQILAIGKQIQDDCGAIIKKLRAILHSTEEQLKVHKKQTVFLTQLAAKTLPKGLHCLPLRLSSEYYSLDLSQQQFPNQWKLEDPKLYHYALFSDNIMAAAVVVNSTVIHAKEPEKHVFHIVTDRLNYAAMRMWFLANPPGNATVDVQNIEEFTWLNSSYSPVLKQLGSPNMIDYYFKAHRANSDSNLKFRNPKYLSILNHLRFYLPEIFPQLNKVLFLDDDIVVQKDLTGLWAIDLQGKVNGAVETCGENFHRFDRYLNFSNPLISKNFDSHACGWAYGMNIFDLEEWKRQNITEVYHGWQKLNHDRTLWKLGTLPPGLITFWKRTFPLDKSWHVLGLGYNPNVNQKDISRAAVIHWNGNMKPWLEIGIPKYRRYWAKFVNYEQVYLRDCNINL